MRIVYQPNTGIIEQVSLSSIKEPSCENIKCKYLETNTCTNNCLILPNDNQFVLNYSKYYIDVLDKKIVKRLNIIPTVQSGDAVLIKTSTYDGFYYYRYSYQTTITPVTFNIILEDGAQNTLKKGIKFFIKANRGTLNKTEFSTIEGQKNYTFQWSPPTYWEKVKILIGLAIDPIIYFFRGINIKITNET